MRHLLSSAALALVLMTAAPAMADDYVILKVNNTDVTQSEVDAMWQGLFPPGGAPSLSAVKPEMRDKILRGIMTEKLLLAEAQKTGVEKSDEVQKQLQEVKNKLLVKVFLEQKTADITDADLKKEYDTLVASTKGQEEVRARHILVPTEKEAIQVKAELGDGKSFEEVARDYSKDPGSAQQGGDLGYFTKDKMVKEFADAAFRLKKGEVSDPVKSEFGWHVIKLEDKRDVVPPTFNETKDMLRQRLQDKKLNDYIRGLVKTADVKLYDAKGKELPFSKNIAE